jgi:hypothetical protein
MTFTLNDMKNQIKYIIAIKIFDELKPAHVFNFLSGENQNIFVGNVVIIFQDQF